MKFVNLERIIIKENISKKTIENILSILKLPDTSINFELMCKENIEDLYLEDITTYNDLLSSSDVDNKSHVYMLKNSITKSTELICFKTHEDRIQTRTLKQQLADVSTNYMISQFKDDTFSIFIKNFYVPLNIFIKCYAKYNNLRIPQDIVLFYKGGNLFRILLLDISKILESQEYIDLLKRSDADFQLFINPDIPNYKKVYEDITILVLYNLIIFKKTIYKLGLFDFFKIDSDPLLQLYKNVLTNNGIKIKHISIIDNKIRKDFAIQPTFYNNEKVILYSEHKTLLLNTPSIKESKEFFISYNTSLDFTRKDNLKAIFDLIRMKRNISLKLIVEDGKRYIISIPCEIIDVSMPRPLDYGLISMKTNIHKYVREYTFQDDKNKFKLWAPNINYMIKDLDDILFKQNDYPWSDTKIDKRLIRYFVSLLFHNIMNGILQKKEIIYQLNEFKKELLSMIRFLQCYIEKNACDFATDQLSQILYVKYIKISKHINNINNLNKRAIELKNFTEFNKKIVIILKTLIKNINVLIANTDKITKQKILSIYKKLITDQNILTLG